MAYIKDIAIYIPEEIISNQDISRIFPEWDCEKIFDKIGISQRHIAGKDEFVSDMAIKAVEKLCAQTNIDKESIDYLIVCTQSPDYKLPTTACLVQEKSGLSTNCAAIDINQGCSGYVYGLSIAKGLIATGEYRNIILVTAETYSKYINEHDKGNISLFGDAATATLISAEVPGFKIGKFTLGTDGRGKNNLILKNGGSKFGVSKDKPSSDDYLYMNGSEIFNFTSKNIPPLVQENLKKNDFNLTDLNYFIFHQANTFMLNFLRKRIGIPENRFLLEMENYGNTVSSTIPIVLKANFENLSCLDTKIMLVGFGVGYSWGATVIQFKS